jgi:hypothetical protein
MTVTLPTAPPVRAVAGDTWTWTDTNSDYPASDGWVVAYVIAGPSTLTWDAAFAVASGDTTTITIPAASTAPLAAGPYRIVATYTLSGARYSVEHPALVVAADPAMLAPGDTVSWAEKTLAVIEAFLGGHLEGGVGYYQIGNRQVTAIPLPELIQMRNNLKAEVAAQRRGRRGVLGPTLAFAYRDPGVREDGL